MSTTLTPNQQLIADFIHNSDPLNQKKLTPTALVANGKVMKNQFNQILSLIADASTNPGPPGPPGVDGLDSDIDGGYAGAVYLFTQLIDGGGA